MLLIETVLLIVAYTLLSISIFLGVICYKKNIETWETLALMVSMLLLVISLTISAILWNESDLKAPTNIFILLSMILVGLTTPINVMAERQHNLPISYKKYLYIGSSLLFISTIISFFTNHLYLLQHVISLLLGVSVIFSMTLIRNSKPQKRLQHIEKSERLFSLLLLFLIPLSLVLNYLYAEYDQILKIGFTLPLIFILLTANKIWDDLQRLSILKSNTIANEHYFNNASLTEREKEIAQLLLKGKTYKQISETLFISLPTVKTHTSNLYKKLDVKNKHELIVLLMN